MARALPFAVDKRGSELVRRQLLGILRDIETNPTTGTCRPAFLARKDVLWDRMNAEDQANAEHARVRELVKPRRPAPRKQSPRVAA
jgi:hypothetical protein